MTRQELLGILTRVQRGEETPEAAHERILQVLRQSPFEDLGFARVDHHRSTRQGFPEVIFGPGKTPAQIAAIAERIVAAGHSLLVTRTDGVAYEHVAARIPDAVFTPLARTITRAAGTTPRGTGTVLLAAAGTADLPVAEEAAVTAEIMGNDVDRLYDVGVAGLHRLLAEHQRLTSARVVIVVAGMEGALPSVVAGLVEAPVIAVPTSVGYGASFGGIAALLGMLNSCASRVSVVNIDNGFGAASIASAINHLP
jgi:NCAIR mutase (PurE)-related protein